MLHQFAGPIFTEWYWGPIFYAVSYGPYILALSILLFIITILILRMVRRSLSLKKMAILLLSIITLITIASVPYTTSLANERRERQAAIDARHDAEFDQNAKETAELYKQLTVKNCQPTASSIEKKMETVINVHDVRSGDGITVKIPHALDTGEDYVRSVELCPNVVVTKNGIAIKPQQIAIGDTLEMYHITDDIFYTTRIDAKSSGN